MTRGWDGTIPKSKQKKQKARPPYWRLINLLKQLRLKYRERDRGESTFHITVEDFGICFRFNPAQPVSEYKGWDIIDVDLKQYELNPLEFGRQLMWILISKGYMAYLRDKESGNSQLYRHFLIKEGWATRIMEKRLELYENQPRHRFQIERNKRLLQKSVHYIVMHHPDFFDYLV